MTLFLCYGMWKLERAFFVPFRSVVLCFFLGGGNAMCARECECGCGCVHKGVSNEQ